MNAIDAEETKRQKARNLRFKKPIIRDLNLDKINEELWDIQEACEEIRWYTDSADGEDTLINALDGDEDEAYEFKMAFAELCTECEKMQMDLQEEWVPKCFDLFFVAISQNSDLLGWDAYEGDYFGINEWSDYARDEATKQLERMTKRELIAASHQCFKVYQAYTGLRNRYDSLKVAIDVLRDQNTGVLQTVREIERLYKQVTECREMSSDYGVALKEFGRCVDALPQEAWIS